jgi:anti-sigma regulatory factor (Ser/Thr protein kinase)
VSDPRGPGPAFPAAATTAVALGAVALALAGVLLLSDGGPGRPTGDRAAPSEAENRARTGMGAEAEGGAETEIGAGTGAEAGVAHTVELTGEPGTAAKARSITRAFLGRIGHSEAALADATELVVSELVTNAIRHGPGPCVLDLEHTGPEVRVSVRDTSSSPPRPRPRRPERPAGHGLEIVRSVCARMSIASSHEGNVVTAWLTIPTAPPAPA